MSGTEADGMEMGAEGEAGGPSARGWWIPIGGIAVGVGYLLASLQLPLGTLDRPGTGFYPRCVAVLLVAASIVGLTWSRRRAADPGGEPVPWVRPFALVAAIACYALAITVVGYLIAATIVGIVCLTIMGHGGWVRRVCYSLALAGATYALFAWVLAVPIPAVLPGW